MSKGESLNLNVTLGELLSPNSKLVSVKRDDSIKKATTMMLLDDFSQLPVLHGERDLKGVISWKSIGRNSARGHKIHTVNDCMEKAEVLDDNEMLIKHIQLIAEKEYSFIRDKTKKIYGILTTYDMTIHFNNLVEPFLLLGMIEGELREIIETYIPKSDYSYYFSVKEHSERRKTIKDLTFSEYITVLCSEDNWEKLDLPTISKEIVMSHLDKVREIRNKVMHFHPEDNLLNQVNILRKTFDFISKIKKKNIS